MSEISARRPTPASPAASGRGLDGRLIVLAILAFVAWYILPRVG